MISCGTSMYVCITATVSHDEMSTSHSVSQPSTTVINHNYYYFTDNLSTGMPFRYSVLNITACNAIDIYNMYTYFSYCRCS